MKKIFFSVMTLIFATLITSCGGNVENGEREAQELSGAGATFPLPFYNVVFEEFSAVKGDVVAYGDADVFLEDDAQRYGGIR